MDLNDPAKSRIPLLSYVGASTNGLVRFIADSDPSKGADHVAFKLSNGGEALGLFHTNGTRIDTVTFGQQYPGVSQGRLPDGAGEIVFFFHTASPGENNHLPLANVVITEVLTHTDPPLEDALEVQNLGEESIDISGWFLSDTTGNLRKYRIPDGKVLSPGGFAVFYEVEFNALPGHRNSFSFSSVRGDQVYLSQADLAGNLSGYRSTAKFGPAENGVSFGRQVTSEGIDFAATLRRTLGADTPSTTNEFHLGNGATNAAVAVGPVVISEIHYHPPNIQTNDNVRDEFIELRNITPSPVGLFHPTYPTNTWRLRDAVDFDFPRNLTLAADELLLVVGFDPSTNTTALAAWRTRFSVPANVRILGPYVGKLDNGSDKVELYRPDNPQLAPHPDAGFVPFVLVDRVHYSDEAPWPTLADTYTQGVGASLQRRVMASYGNEATNWLAGAPTAGRPTGSPLVTLPAITTQPQGARVSEGLNYTLKVVASGAAPLSYQWRLGAELILNATNSSYTVTSVGATNVGNYTVVVSNPSGAVVSAMALVRAGGAPAVLEDPVPQFVEQGADAVFSVLAGGTQPLRYQWRRNGLNLAQATNQQLLVRNVQPVNAGNYAVVITNVFGSVTSAVATLTLGTRPSITVPPASQDALAGNDVALSVQAAGTGPLAYQWLRGKLPIAGATQANLRLNRVSLGQSGDYSVVVSNLFGSVTSVVARLSVFPLPAVTVTVVDDTAREAGLDPGLFLVTRSYPTNQPLTVFFGLGGTALPGGDYLPVSAVTIPAGEAAAVVTITPIDDKIKEPTELVSLSLALGPGYVVGLPAADTLSLLDDDAVQIGGTNVVELVSITNEWRYEQTQDLSEVLWKTPTFDDSAWPSGPAGLTAETAALPVPKLTPLTLGRWSYYFRTTFHLASTQDVALTAEFAVDDGAVFYLNGEEARRVGMPPGQVVYSTPASQTIGNATLVGPVSLPTTNLVVGRNVLAVEVHQSGIDSSDVVFAMSLAAQLVAEVRLELVDPQLSPAGDFAFNLVGTPSRKVQLETSTDLVSWTVWQIVDLPLTGVLRISERPGSAPAVRFYRARPAF